jgi:hypothetical protein
MPPARSLHRLHDEHADRNVLCDARP